MDLLTISHLFSSDVVFIILPLLGNNLVSEFSSPFSLDSNWLLFPLNSYLIYIIERADITSHINYFIFGISIILPINETNDTYVIIVIIFTYPVLVCAMCWVAFQAISVLIYLIITPNSFYRQNRGREKLSSFSSVTELEVAELRFNPGSLVLGLRPQPHCLMEGTSEIVDEDA